MDPICISSAAVLRCTSLTVGQNIAFIVPVALEFLASGLLLFLKRGSGKQHLLLVAEGWIYFILAMVELLSAIPSLSKDNVNRFRSFDIGIGIASFLPLLLYTLHLYLFTHRELLTNLPKYLINVAKVSMFLSLPMIIATNEVASVTGITVVFDSTGKVPSLAFSSSHDEWLWLFFTSLTLAILTAYQATVFSFSFFRLIWILVQQHRGKYDIKVRGIGWISAGVKLGALEAIIGFGGGSFEVSMTRRVMRLMGRACFCVGLVIGVDPAAAATQRSYDNLEKTDPKIRRSHPTISNPRVSTFQQLSPVATHFHSNLRNPGAPGTLQTSPTTAGSKAPHYLTFTQRQRVFQGGNGPSHGISQLHSLNDTAQQRVTVLRDDGGPPLLQMRFSVLDVPLIPDAAHTLTAEKENEETLSHKDLEQLPEATLVSSRGSVSLDMDDILPIPKPPFTRSLQSRSSAISSMSSIVEIIDVPRRTISQRRAAARVILTRMGEVEKQESNDTGPFEREISGSNPVSDRPPTPGPLFSMSRDATTAGAHRRTATQSISIKSVADSLQAVQELASQFPPLPPSISFDHSGLARPPTPYGGPFVHAIGSPTDLEAVGGSPFTTGDDADCHRTAFTSPYISNGQVAPAYQHYEEGIVWTPRDEGEHSPTPSSSHSRCSVSATVRQSIILTLEEDTLLTTQSPPGLDALTSKPEVQISGWADDSFEGDFGHERIPQSPEIRDNFVSWRPPSVINPKPIDTVPTTKSNIPIC